jgi:hypothetical protein
MTALKTWKPWALGITAVVIATATFVPIVRNSRSVRPWSQPQPLAAVEPARFDRNQSAALFVGIRRFTHSELIDVPYAADDAVDLAYMFAIDRRVGLVPPERVVLALSGRPQKVDSQRRLRELQQAGAQVEHADQSDLLTLMQRQAALAGKDGIFIVSLATHGFVRDGVPYILGATSLFRYPETALSTAKLFDIAATSEARRSLIFVDACRERIAKGARAGSTESQAAAPLVRRMAHVAGQVIFYAAPAGGYAYDNPRRQNGVFTAAVIDGLSCKATASRGVVTVETLRTFVERDVRNWIRQNRDPSIDAAIQVSMDGDSKNMPLSLCWQAPGASLNRAGPTRVATDGSSVTAFGADGAKSWQRDVGGRILRAEIADLDADGKQEVVVGVAQPGKIVAFDSAGNRLWSAEEGMRLRRFITGDLFRKHTRQVVGLWVDDRSPASRLSIVGSDGGRLSSLDHTGHLQHVAIDRPTARHAPKIVVSTANSVFVLDPKRVATGSYVWYGAVYPRSAIEKLEIVDHDHDGRRDISIATAEGNTFFLDFDGNVLTTRKTRHAPADARFTLVHRPRRPRRGKAASG